jgi:hypothetical protein
MGVRAKLKNFAEQILANGLRGAKNRCGNARYPPKAVIAAYADLRLDLTPKTARRWRSGSSR